jgi:hypothetical protein
MTPKTRNILIVSTLLLIGVGVFFVKRKTNQAFTIMENLQIKPIRISNIKLKLNNISFNLDLELFNPTNESLNINTFGLASLTRITLYYNNIFLGESNVNQENFFINENSSTIIKNIPININTLNILDVLPDFISGKPALNKFRANATISALGQDYTIQTI